MSIILLKNEEDCTGGTKKCTNNKTGGFKMPGQEVRAHLGANRQELDTSRLLMVPAKRMH